MKQEYDGLVLEVGRIEVLDTALGSPDATPA